MAILNIINPAICKGKESILALKDCNFLKGKNLKAFIACLKDKLSFSGSFYNDNELYLALRSLKTFVAKLENPSLKILCIETIQTSGLFPINNQLPYNPKKLPKDIKEEFGADLKLEFKK